jgi:choline kinase
MAMTRRDYLSLYGNSVVKGAGKFRIVHVPSGEEIEVGATVESSRGEKYTLTGISRFRSSEVGKTGKVLVSNEHGPSEYYDNVFDLEVQYVDESPQYLWSVYDEDGDLVDVNVSAPNVVEALGQFSYASGRWYATPQEARVD